MCLGIIDGIPYVLQSLFDNGIWFVTGMSLVKFHWYKRINIQVSILCGIIFILGTFIFTKCCISFKEYGVLLSCFACVSIIGVFYNLKIRGRILDLFAKYTMPIFLLHTICAAGFRVFLNKMNINNPIIHIVFGILASFIGPIILYELMKKTKYLELLIYPNKIINLKEYNK